MKKIILKRTVTATGGRQGVLHSDDGNIHLKLDLPPELGGQPATQTTNPEQLFATGYASCFASSLEYVLKTNAVIYEDLSVAATAILLKDDSLGGFKFAIELIVHILGLKKEEAERFSWMAYEFCPYSKAIRNNVEVKLQVK